MLWEESECVGTRDIHALRLLKFACKPDGIELTIIIIGTFAQAVVGSARAVNIFAVIIIWRFFVSSSPSQFSRNITDSQD
jgi:hypothetical protein